MPSWDIEMNERNLMAELTESQRFQVAQNMIPSPGVLTAFERSNSFLPPSTARDKNLTLLQKPEVTCVVTGQQVGLYLGPLFTLYKAMTAIILAAKLAEQTGTPCVPVFWLQTEDHDLEEISSTRILNREGEQVELSLPTSNPSQSQCSVAYQQLGEEILSLNEKLESTLGFYPEAERYLEHVREWYRPGRTYHEAFSGLLAELLPESGLVFFNPRQDEVYAEAGSILRRSVRESRTVANLLIEQTDGLTQSGVEPQVYIRPDSPLAFYHLGDAGGARFRLQENGENWVLIGDQDQREISSAEVEENLKNNLSRFSSSALLRPIMQDSLLPSVAYVGGAAEELYFKQIQPLY